MIETSKGTVKSFLVQLEILDAGEWKAYVQFNHAHGRPHRDLFRRDGREEKTWYEVTDLGRFINDAYQDLSKNFRIYAERMGYA